MELVLISDKRNSLTYPLPPLFRAPPALFLSFLTCFGRVETSTLAVLFSRLGFSPLWGDCTFPPDALPTVLGGVLVGSGKLVCLTFLFCAATCSVALFPWCTMCKLRLPCGALYCIVLYLQPVLNPEIYDGARVLEASGSPMLVIGRS